MMTMVLPQEMTPERWRWMEYLFGEALALPASQRAGWLERECGADVAALREVESLLAFESQAEDFIEKPIWADAAPKIENKTSRTRALAEQTIANYRVRELIGQGGMGKVFRATDLRLGREVALKVLSPSLTGDAERVERFEREAKILAVLNHPNIATIHAFEQSTAMPYLVLEYIQGETLAVRMCAGPMNLNDVVTIFRQIAAALEAAHARHIIHRDLKPANVKITPQGIVKVLDFGLAKVAYDGSVTKPLRETRELTAMPTRPLSDTQCGMVLGTVPYMSPEQTKGETLDRATDWWSFGCMLYEALTGKTPFDGDNHGAVVWQINEAEPDWNALPAETPVALITLLRRCFTKSPSRRLRDATEVYELLAEAQSAASSAQLTSLSATRPTQNWWLVSVAMLVWILSVYWLWTLIR